MKDSYTKKEVAELTGLPYRSVQFFTDQGAIVPEVEQAAGRGKFRRYSHKNLVSFVVAGELASYGLTVSEIRTAVAIMDVFWRTPKKVMEGGAYLEGQAFHQDSEALKMVASLDMELIISRTKDKDRIYHLRIGKDESGDAVLKYSAFKGGPQGKIAHLYSKQSGLNALMDATGQLLKGDFDVDSYITSAQRSYIFVAISSLVKEMLNRMP